METGPTVQGGVAHERTPTGSSANYLTTSGGIWDTGTLNFNGFGGNADGTTTYPISFSVQRANSTDALVTLSINGIARTYSDTGDGAFSFDTLALAKIGDQDPFRESATFTISDFAAVVMPEPSTALLMLLGGPAFLRRRKRACAMSRMA